MRCWWACSPSCGSGQSWRPRWAGSQALRAYGLRITAANLVNWGLESLDRLLVSRSLGPAALGAYSVAATLARAPVTLLVSSAQPVAFAAAARLQDQNHRLARGYHRGARAGLAGRGATVRLPVLVRAPGGGAALWAGLAQRRRRPSPGCAWACPSSSCWRSTNIDIAFTKRIGAGFFGGEGFILQKLSGDGLVFVHAGGTVIEKDLARGETLRVDTGCLVAFHTTVDYDIKFVGGFKNALFGGEGLFFAKMTGPGKVYLQSLPFSRLVDRIKRGITFSHSGDETKGMAGLGGDILKNIISGS